MKKSQKAKKQYEKLKAQFKQVEMIAENTKPQNLWTEEKIIRKKIRALKEFENMHFSDYNRVFSKYVALLDSVSIRLLEHYNEKNNSDYVFEEIVKEDRRGYLSSGILSVLVTSHIPSLVAKEFTKYFPENPKDEYKQTRQIKRKFYLHLGETNTGKTYNAIQRLKQASTGVYLAPLRILALENYERLNSEGVRCNLLTGEEEQIVEGATIVSCTIEKLDIESTYDIAIIDEIQMIANSQRGQSWTRALLGLKCKEIHVCGALNAKELIIKIIEDLDDEYELKEYKRDIPLRMIRKPFELKEAEKGDALVVFSKKRVLELSKHYMDKGFKTSVIYGDLPPEVRRLQYNAFISGQSKILISTDAIGMGVNLPIKRIIFMEIQKFDGEEVRFLTTQDIKQIAGRAGRKGIYDIGYVGAAGLNQKFIKRGLENEDDILKEAVIGPSEAILQIKKLPLNEKLALWSTREEKLDYYKKMDIRDYLLILDVIKSYNLPEEMQFKLLKLPFDVGSNELMSFFVDYVDDYFVRKVKELRKPKLIYHTLSDLELYYQKINLYYSFSKNFGLKFDEKWVYTEREDLSVKINSLLLKL